MKASGQHCQMRAERPWRPGLFSASQGETAPTMHFTWTILVQEFLFRCPITTLAQESLLQLFKNFLNYTLIVIL